MKLITKANEVGLFMDYSDHANQNKYQREYLVVRAIKSDVSVWEFQCTVRYDKRWSQEKIDLMKKEAIKIVSGFQYIKKNPIDNLEFIAKENGVKNFDIQTQRLDKSELNEKFKE